MIKEDEVKDKKTKHGQIWIMLGLIMSMLIISWIVEHQDFREITTTFAQELAVQRLHVFAIEKKMPYVAKYLSVVIELEKACSGKLSAKDIVTVANIIVEYCQTNQDIGLTEDIVFGLIERESGFNPKAISVSKAFGIMQILYSTAERYLKDMGYQPTLELLLNPVVNIEVGLRELVRIRKEFMSYGIDSWHICLAAYYWGDRPILELVFSKERGVYASLEYGQGVMALAKKWKEKGI